MHRILEFPLVTFLLGLWRLGQSGLVLRARGGPVVVVDPCLTDPTPEWMPLLRRRFPPPFAPEALQADVVLLTHAHPHHCDPATLAVAPALARADFLGPPAVGATLARLGVPEDRVHVLAPGGAWSGRGTAVRAVRAWHAADVPDALGFRVELGGSAVFATGDTKAHDGLAAGGPADVLVLPINGKRGNLGAEDAAALVAALGPRYAVPCHYDLIAADGEDPDAFVLHAALRGVGDRVRVLPVMAPLLLDRDGLAAVADEPLAMGWPCAGPLPSAVPPPPYRCRAFRPADIPALAGLYGRVFGPGRDDSWFRRDLMARPWFEPDRVAVIELDGRPVAAAVAGEDERAPAGRDGLLDWVATDPDHHERGLGKAAAAAVMGWFRRDGRRGVTLRVEDRRLRAIRSHLALGFTAAARGEEDARRWDNVRAALRAEADLTA